jgi:hypothetical protein
MRLEYKHEMLNEELVNNFLTLHNFKQEAHAYFELISLAVGKDEVEDFMRWHLYEKHNLGREWTKKEVIDSLENTIMFLDRNERVRPLVLEALSMVVQRLREF